MSDREGSIGSAPIAATIDDLMQPQVPKDIFIKSLDKQVKIKALNVGELADISKVARDDPMLTAIFMVMKGLVEPHLKDITEARALRPIALTEIAGHIATLSGMGAEALEKVRNLSE